MAFDNEPADKVMLHDWAAIPKDAWKTIGIDLQEAVKTCHRCELQVKMKRKIEFDGFGPRVAVAYRKKGGDWEKMYKPGQPEKRALPDCITLTENLKKYKEKH